MNDVSGCSMCVSCGAIPATEGSIKHPYCRSCFKELWDNDYHSFNEWMAHGHDSSLPKWARPPVLMDYLISGFVFFMVTSPVYIVPLYFRLSWWVYPVLFFCLLCVWGYKLVFTGKDSEGDKRAL